MRGDNDRQAGFVFYQQDYFGDMPVRLMPGHLRIVWIECIFLMSDSPRRGVLLKENGESYSLVDLATICNVDVAVVQQAVEHVIKERIASVDRKTGALISRRMMRDEIKLQACRKAGQRGWKIKSGKMAESKQLNLTLKPSSNPEPEPDPEPNPEPNPEPDKKTRIPIPSPASDRSPYSPEFEIFWAAFPPHRHIAKGAAWKAWRNTPHPPVTVLVGKIEEAKRSADWCKDGGRYVPRAATWINGHGWNDEYAPGNNGAGEARASVQELQRMAEADFGPLRKKGKETQ